MGRVCATRGCSVATVTSADLSLCWLKKQKGSLAPEQIDAEGETVSWTSGLIFGKGEITNVVKLSSLSVDSYILLISLWHAFHYQFRMFGIDISEGAHGDMDTLQLKKELLKKLENLPMGWSGCFWSPFALIQGTLEAQGGEGSIFKKIPIEDCPTIRRGPVAWWRTVFGSVLPEDMHIADKISILPTKSDVWKNVNVTILKNLVPLMLRRIEKGHENFNSKADPA
ncbi:hypothetical protein JHK82_012007 [Glycine max]|nr:hypothetical protein JHK85_012328 [Glycine max]KAG5057004.1 hypothetical protein JHK86_012000 [Glycine max]KAG5154038.1 hypothetical protein JHK82_012007 [Glycine max]